MDAETYILAALEIAEKAATTEQREAALEHLRQQLEDDDEEPAG